MRGIPKEACRPIEILMVEDNPGDVRLVRDYHRSPQGGQGPE